MTGLGISVVPDSGQGPRRMGSIARAFGARSNWLWWVGFRLDGAPSDDYHVICDGTYV